MKGQLLCPAAPRGRLLGISGGIDHYSRKTAPLFSGRPGRKACLVLLCIKVPDAFKFFYPQLLVQRKDEEMWPCDYQAWQKANLVPARSMPVALDFERNYIAVLVFAGLYIGVSIYAASIARPGRLRE